jgi:hypothetical protein
VDTKIAPGKEEFDGALLLNDGMNIRRACS